MSGDLSPTQHCPHVGMQSDRQTWHAFAMPENYCHKMRPPRSVPVGHQEVACLTADHETCPVFQHSGAWTDPLPAALTQSKAGRRWESEWMAGVAGQPPPPAQAAIPRPAAPAPEATSLPPTPAGDGLPPAPVARQVVPPKAPRANNRPVPALVIVGLVVIVLLGLGLIGFALFGGGF